MSTIFDYRWAIKNKLMEKLYEDQLKYWNLKLSNLAFNNALTHGRGIDVVNNRMTYAIYYDDKEWRPQHLDWTKRDESKYCLELHPSNPQLADEMAVIADELGEIEEERYEAERFLSGLLMFEAPPEIFQKVLGDVLYEPCKTEVLEFCSQFSTDVWDKNGEFSMNIFIERYQSIITAMKQRLLRNIVSLEEL